MRLDGTAPKRALAALTVFVVALHVLFLAATPGTVNIAVPEQRATLVTRRIEASPPVAPSPAITQQTASTAPIAIRPMRAPAAVPPHVALPTLRERSAGAVVQPSVPAPAAPAPQPRAASFTLPGSMRLHYTVAGHTRGADWQSRSELMWRHDGQQYEARMELQMPQSASRIQRSTGRITSHGLAPIRFADKTRSEEATHFDYDKSQLIFSSNRPVLALTPGAQDRLSVLLQLGAMIAGAPDRFPAGTHIPVQTVGTRDAEIWQFTVQGDEELPVAGGSMHTVKLFRLAQREYDQSMELWLAPGMDYVPVRLRLTQPNADWLDQQWVRTDR